MTPINLYDGSTIFQPLSDMSGFSIDKINFVICQLMVVLLGFPFRLVLGPHLVSATIRHIVEITVGLFIAYFCFGNQTLLLVLQSTMCLLVLWTAPSELIGACVLGLAMGFLSVYHLTHMIYHYGGSTIDIAGPLMISTQRLTSLAFGLQDGIWGYKADYTEAMKKQAIQRQPSLVEFYSYIFSFHGLLCGPFCFYKDYIAFVDGTNYMPTPVAPIQSENDFGQAIEPPPRPPPPAPGAELKTRLLTATVFSLLTIALRPFFPITWLTGIEYNLQSFTIRCLMTILLPFIERHKYYTVWKLGEAANISSGLGFTGYDDLTGCPKWDLIDNVNILKVELATSPKMFLDNWNISTMKWLRYVIYDRWHSMAVVLLFSASFHGFYGGYYLAAFTLLLVLMAAQKIRRFVDPCSCGGIDDSPFQSTYNALTFLVTGFCVSYAACAFMLLSFEPAFAFYSRVYFWIQALCVAAIIVL